MPSPLYTDDDHARTAALADAKMVTETTDEDVLIRVAHYILTGEHPTLPVEITEDSTTILEGGGVQQVSLADRVGGGSAVKLGVNVTRTQFPPDPTEEEIQRYAEQFRNAVSKDSPLLLHDVNEESIGILNAEDAARLFENNGEVPPLTAKMYAGWDATREHENPTEDGQG